MGAIPGEELVVSKLAQPFHLDPARLEFLGNSGSKLVMETPLTSVNPAQGG